MSASASTSNITVLVIEKNGDVREHVIKSFDESELYKKAGFKTADGFKSHTEWNIEDLNDQQYNISIYGKTKGRANQENKYEFPPPIDNILFFGSCVLVNRQNGIPVSFRTEDWENVYDYLYGGFEDADEDDEDDDDDEEDSEEDGGVPLNKYGYAKDGFVVDDDEEAEDEYETEEEDEEMDENGDASRKKSKTSNNKKSAAAASKKKTVTTTSVSASGTATASAVSSKKTAAASKKATLAETIVAEILENVFECTSELSEESYLE